MPEFQWLFLLAGFLRSNRPGARPSDLRVVQSAEPAALEFARRIERTGGGSGDYIDWSDADAVLLEFHAAWLKRKHVQGGDFFDRAIALSEKNPLGLPSSLNAWVIRIASLGFVLQEMQPDLPFLIPVNEGTAKKLGTSLRTLSLAVNGAIAAKLLTVEERAGETGGNRFARRLRFNYRSRFVKGLTQDAKDRIRSKLQSETCTSVEDEYDPFADD